MSDSGGGGKTRYQNKLHHFLIRKSRARLHQFALYGLGAYGIDVQPGAVIGKADHDFRAFMAGGDVDLSHRRFTGALACVLALHAVVDSVAYHVFERAYHAIKHGSIDFHLVATEFQFHALVQFARRLAHDVAQARGLGGKADHARAHQTFLQIGVDARLLLQDGFRLADKIVHARLYGIEIVQTFGQAARQLLQAREPVEFQRIELGAGGRQAFFRTIKNLRFGMDFELADLIAETRDVAVEFRHVLAETKDLLLHARARDTHFAGIVHQVIKQTGAYPDLTAPIAGLGRGLALLRGIAAL